MTFVSLGDLAQQSSSLRQTSAIKSRLATLTEELSTGLTADLVERTGGGTGRIDGIMRELETIEGYLATNLSTEQRLNQSQEILTSIDVRRANLANQAAIMAAGNAGQPIANIAEQARSEMSAAVNLLNRSFNGEALFAGTAIDSNALISADAMLADIAGTLTPASSAADIRAAVDNWFDGPVGFATIGYTGDGGPALERRVSAVDSVSFDARADDPAIINTLKAFAGLAIVDQLGPTVPDATIRDVLNDRLDEFFSVGAGLVDLKARIGTDEEVLARANTALEAQKTTLSLERNERTTTDQFETASLLQDIQRQLELHFTATARLSQLSLVNYL